jgi:hypothetical protein
MSRMGMGGFCLCRNLSSFLRCGFHLFWGLIGLLTASAASTARVAEQEHDYVFSLLLHMTSKGDDGGYESRVDHHGKEQLSFHGRCLFRILR